MDINSQNAIQFLTLLQQVRSKISNIENHCSQMKFNKVKDFFVITPGPYGVITNTEKQEYDGCLSFGLHIIGGDNLEYELCVEVAWCDSYWSIESLAWVENEHDEGYTPICESVYAQATTLNECIEKVLALTDHLIEFCTLIPQKR